jgi:hypothetical protein
VWPENWPALQIFVRVKTQWACSFSGVLGLRYEAVYPLIDRATSDPQEWEHLMDGVQALESGALEEMSRKDD